MCETCGQDQKNCPGHIGHIEVSSYRVVTNANTNANTASDGKKTKKLVYSKILHLAILALHRQSQWALRHKWTNETQTNSKTR